MSFSLIAAIGENRELGKKGGLVFKIPGDLKFFKTTTLGHPVFMGLNTWRSLPGKLPQREHYVLAPSTDDVPKDLHAVTDLEQFIQDHRDDSEEFFVIGGGMVYTQMLPYCNKLYLTEVHSSDKDADTFFPAFKKSAYTKTILGHGQDGDISYDHVLYTLK